MTDQRPLLCALRIWGDTQARQFVHVSDIPEHQTVDAESLYRAGHVAIGNICRFITCLAYTVMRCWDMSPCPVCVGKGCSTQGVVVVGNGRGIVHATEAAIRPLPGGMIKASFAHSHHSLWSPPVSKRYRPVNEGGEGKCTLPELVLLRSCPHAWRLSALVPESLLLGGNGVKGARVVLGSEVFQYEAPLEQEALLYILLPTGALRHQSLA